MERRSFLKVLCCVMLVLAIPVSLTTAAEGAKEYKIGDTGPAGGIVFYDKGSNTDGWRYLEAAPASKETEVSVQWGAFGTDAGGTGIGIGSGKKNTQAIVDGMNELGVSVPAVQFCANLNFGGSYDWYSPSKAELNLMFSNLKMRGLGDFKGDRYWSSTEVVNETRQAWVQNFSDGSQGGAWRNESHLVRAVRQF
jgi:hypothetical protein